MPYDHDPHGQREHTEYVRFDQARACEFRIHVIALPEDNAEKSAGYGADQCDVARLVQGKVNLHRNPEGESGLQQILQKNCNQRAATKLELLSRNNQTCEYESGPRRR